MRNEGISKEEILNILDKKLEGDYAYDMGYILGSMCTEPLDFGKEVYTKYMHKNLGDPGLFKKTAELENELVAEIGELLSGKNIIGTFTTGGSEANIVAMRLARKSRPEIRNPEIIVPASAHISFEKGADLMGVTVKKARLKDDFELDVEHFESLVNENTCGIVGIAGSTSLGLIDPISELGNIIEGKNIFFHIDAAFGGFVLPFLEKLGHQIPPWDFRVNNVCSITSDPHKMGLGIIPSGGLFLKDSSVLEHAGFEIPYLAGGGFKHLHIVGTRPGGTVIAFWAIMNYLGLKGYKDIVKKCMDNTYYLANRVSEIDGVKLAAEPVMNVLGITTENGKSVCEMDDEFRKRDWMLGKFTDFNLIRVVIMPHVTENHLESFCNDMEDIVKKLNLN
ncbi:MAG: tyrosine decarboxylase MfnA [Promethearchaeota archaeon]